MNPPEYPGRFTWTTFRMILSRLLLYYLQFSQPGQSLCSDTVIFPVPLHVEHVCPRTFPDPSHVPHSYFTFTTIVPLPSHFTDSVFIPFPSFLLRQLPLHVTENSRPHLHVPVRVTGSVIPGSCPHSPT